MLNEIESVGHPFVQMLTDILWYIDSQYHKLESRSRHAKVPPVPKMFKSLTREMKAITVVITTGE